MQFGHCTQKWIGLFVPLNVFIGVKAYIGEEAFMTFDVQDNGRNQLQIFSKDGMVFLHNVSTNFGNGCGAYKFCFR